MRRTVVPGVALAVVVLSAVGCAQKPAAGAPQKNGDVKSVPPPAELVGKWNREVTDGKNTRTSVYHFTKDGRVEIETRDVSPDRKQTSLVKRAVVEAGKDRITVVDLFRTGDDGVEEAVKPERQKPRTLTARVEGDELTLIEVDPTGTPLPDTKPVVLKRVKP